MLSLGSNCEAVLITRIFLSLLYSKCFVFVVVVFGGIFFIYHYCLVLLLLFCLFVVVFSWNLFILFHFSPTQHPSQKQISVLELYTLFKVQAV